MTSSQMKESRPRCWVVLVGAGGVTTSQTRWWGLEPHQSHSRGKSGPGNPAEKQMATQFGNEVSAWEPWLWSMCTVSSHCCGSFHMSTCGPETWLLSYIYIHLHSRSLLIVSQKPDSSIWNPWIWNLPIYKFNLLLCEICLWPHSSLLVLAPVECTLGAQIYDAKVTLTGKSKVAFWHLGRVLLMSWVELVDRPWKKKHCFCMISACFLVILFFQTLFLRWLEIPRGSVQVLQLYIFGVHWIASPSRQASIGL